MGAEVPVWRAECRRGPPGAGARAAGAVGYGQQGGNRQHQPMAACRGGVQAARLVPIPADGLQAPEALLHPIAAGIPGGLRMRHRRVGQQHPGLRLAVGVQHTPTGSPGGLQRRVTGSPPGPVISESTDRRWVWPSG